MIDNDPNVRFVSVLTKNTYALVLAGGRGSRLKNLTDWRAKPAVPFGGKFRIIDFPMSNCVNSGIRRIGVATQYKSHSLIRHIQRGWSFLDGRFQEFVDILPASQRTTEQNWYLGTADAVYQNLDILRSYGPDYILVLAGDGGLPGSSPGGSHGVRRHGNQRRLAGHRFHRKAGQPAVHTRPAGPGARQHGHLCV
jgi:glucose-1-phosphate adenylyltransferase